MDILDRDLESVECASFGDLNLCHELRGEILEDNAIGGGKEGEDVSDEVALVGGQGLEMAEVVGEVDFLGGPEGGHRALVELPDLRVLDRKHAESIGIWGQERFFHDRRHDWKI